ncbi:lasso peptide biosynthesis B2 protein [Micromonospora sp. CPCC 205561]|uniref:lasso peptide biosynthesis B2 protein n=1 Tax=Micromonospora sp. CPCC 205561 TaxID=3122407 RepID=UPI002FF1B89E
MTAVPAAVRCLALDATAAVVTRALAEQGVEAVLLKGAGLARRLGLERQRIYSDIDLLVAPASFATAQRVLADLGCRSALPEERPDRRSHWYERPWRVPGPVPLTVDLHRGFHGVADPEALWSSLSGAAVRIPLAGGTVAVPDETGTALLVALHAAAPGRSGRPLADLERALEVFAPETWRAAADLAARTGAVPLFALGLRLTPAGAELAAALGLPRRTTPALWIRAHRGSPVALTLAQLAELPTARDRLRHLVPRLFPSPAAMRHSSALARRGPAGLFLAHLARVLRNLGRLPAALAELRVAGRAVRRSAVADRPRPPGRGAARGGALPAVFRLARRGGLPALRTALWAARAARLARIQVARHDLASVRLPAPPPGAGAHRHAVLGVLRRTGANCLQRSLVLQRWYGSQRVARTLVIGVTAPSSGFHAHAWLDGETDARREAMVEILRRPTPQDWLTDAAQGS